MTDEQKQAVERLEKLLPINAHLWSEAGKDLNTLLKAVREMGEDTKRLDWMDDMEAHANDHGRQVFTVYEIAPFTNRANKSLRAAIDAAISQSGKEG